MPTTPSPEAKPARSRKAAQSEPPSAKERSVFAGLDSADPEARQEIIDEVTARSVVTDPL